MNITKRKFQSGDFELVSEFLFAIFKPVLTNGNCPQPAWEYMHTHPSLEDTKLDRIGIWEDEGEIVGVAHFEINLGETYFQIHPDYPFLKVEMLMYAEEHLLDQAESGEMYLRAYINDFDIEFERRSSASRQTPGQRVGSTYQRLQDRGSS